MRHSSRNQQGQTLLELLIALFILVLVLTATIALIVNSINAGRESRNRLVAASLAREGVEIVRNIRDSNWIDPGDPTGIPVVPPPNWDEGLVGNSPAIPFVNSVSATTPTQLYFDPASQNQTAVKLYSDAYVQGAVTPGSDTQFYRLIYLDPICQDDTSPNPNEAIVDKGGNYDCGAASTNVAGYNNKVGIRVIVEVHWPTEASSKKVVVEDRLYDWQVL
jgi:type II secretory pathway pseudopilin PulG